MKTQLLFISVFLVSFNFLKAQDDYISTIKENAYWFVVNKSPSGFLIGPDFDPNTVPLCSTLSLSFGFRGDTIINDIAYKKFWYKLYSTERQTSPSVLELFENGYLETGVMAFMREDPTERKVYAIYTGEGYPGDCASNEEIEIYDFSRMVGDILDLSCMFAESPMYAVESISSVDVFGKTCKEHIIRPIGIEPSEFIPISMIEGMGSRFGPLDLFTAHQWLPQEI